MWAEPGGNLYQVGERLGLHLLHYLASVCLHGDLTDAELSPDLFVQQTRDDQRHHLPFATGE